MMNNEDLFVQAILKPMENRIIRADLHFLKLNDKNNCWYMGAGPTQKSGTIFGYIARPSMNKHDLGNVLDLVAMATITQNVSATLYRGHTFGGDVIKGSYNRDEDGDYFYTELSGKF